MNSERAVPGIVTKVVLLHHGVVVLLGLLLHDGGHAVLDGKADLVVEYTLLAVFAQLLLELVNMDILLVLEFGSGVAICFGLGEKADRILIFQLRIDVLFVRRLSWLQKHVRRF